MQNISTVIYGSVLLMVTVQMPSFVWRYIFLQFLDNTFYIWLVFTLHYIWRWIECISPTRHIEIGTVSLMHSKYVTYLQLENESESGITGNFVASQSLRIVDW